MHEMAIAVEVVRQLEALADEHGADRVEEFTLVAGALRGIVPEAMRVAFEAASEGTCARGARMNLEIVLPVARCRHCGRQYQPAADSFLCEHCNQADVEIVQGNDIVLSSVAFRTPEGAT